MNLNEGVINARGNTSGVSLVPCLAGVPEGLQWRRHRKH